MRVSRTWVIQTEVAHRESEKLTRKLCHGST